MPFNIQPPLYSVWQGMKRRCDNPNLKSYADYGGRGITVCDRWVTDYRCFAEDMGPRPAGYTLDRVNNDLGYSPENCRWATRKDQQRNRRGTLYVTIEGSRHLVAELAEISGRKPDTIVYRAGRGLHMREILRKGRIFKPSEETVAKAVAGNKRRTDAQTHCKRGHKFTKDSTYFTKQGWRSCRVCRRKPA